MYLKGHFSALLTKVLPWKKKKNDNLDHNDNDNHNNSDNNDDDDDDDDDNDHFSASLKYLLRVTDMATLDRCCLRSCFPRYKSK